jgi:branched-chain amino acid transport system substrate-binding protein
LNVNARFLLTGLAGVAALGSLLTLGQSPARAADDIVIGFATAQSGPEVPYDADGTRMALLWVEETNAAGGLMGRKLRAVFADTKSDRTEGAKAGQAVLRDGASVVVVTCDYDYGSPAALQAQRAGVISVSICAGDAKMGVLGVGNLSFSASNVAQAEGAALAQWSLTDKKFTTGYVLLDDSIEYDKSLCAGYEWLFPLKGGKIVGKDTFKNADPSIASQITRLSTAMKTEKVEAIMFCSYAPGGPSAIRQLRAAGINLPIMTGVGLDGTFWFDSVPRLSEYYVAVQASIFGDPRPSVEAVKAKFKAKYGVEPINQHAYPIYGWFQLWAKAVATTNSVEGKTVVAEMETYKKEPTALGPRSFSKELHIQATAPLVINQITDGKGKAITIVEAPEVPHDVLYRLKK